MKKMGRERVEQDGGVLPTTGFPRDDGMATGNMQETRQARCKREHIKHHMHSFTGIVSGLYL